MKREARHVLRSVRAHAAGCRRRRPCPCLALALSACGGGGSSSPSQSANMPGGGSNPGGGGAPGRGGGGETPAPVPGDAAAVEAAVRLAAAHSDAGSSAWHASRIDAGSGSSSRVWSQSHEAGGYPATRHGAAPGGRETARRAGFHADAEDSAGRVRDGRRDARRNRRPIGQPDLGDPHGERVRTPPLPDDRRTNVRRNHLRRHAIPRYLSTGRYRIRDDGADCSEWDNPDWDDGCYAWEHLGDGRYRFEAVSGPALGESGESGPSSATSSTCNPPARGAAGPNRRPRPCPTQARRGAAAKADLRAKIARLSDGVGPPRPA